MGFFQEGINNIGTNDNPFYDYIYKPFYWVVLVGVIPMLLSSIWLGWQIKRQEKVIFKRA